MFARTSFSIVFTALCSLLVSVSLACASPRGRVYIRTPPPAAIVDVRPAAPGPRFVWVAGYQGWNGRAYAWVPGRWVAPPRPRALWVPAHWARERRGWYFVPGHWRTH